MVYCWCCCRNLFIGQFRQFLWSSIVVKSLWSRRVFCFSLQHFGLPCSQSVPCFVLQHWPSAAQLAENTCTSNRACKILVEKNNRKQYVDRKRKYEATWSKQVIVLSKNWNITSQYICREISSNHKFIFMQTKLIFIWMKAFHEYSFWNRGTVSLRISLFTCSDRSLVRNKALSNRAVWQQFTVCLQPKISP